MYSNLDTWTFLWQQSAGPMYLPLQIKVREIVERVELRVTLQLMWPAVHESHLMIDIFAKTRLPLDAKNSICIHCARNKV